MTNQNFTTTFSVDQTPEETFKAINNVRGWWSKDIEGSTDKLGAEFKYHYKDVHRCKMQITEFVPGQKVVWLVLENYFNFTEDKTEWKGTKVIFEISKIDYKTQGTDTSLSLLIPLAAADATAPLVKIMRLRFCTCNRDGQDARSLDG